MTEAYDIVIAGARCAGASLAAFLARGGFKVALFEQAPLPSEHVVSTHTLHPRGMDVLDALGVGDAVRVMTPGSRVIRFCIDEVTVDAAFRDGRREYCPRRHRLDALLQDAAVADGARLFDRTRVLGTVTRDGRVTGVRIKDGAGEREVAARLVVGADGRHSRIAACVNAAEYLGYDAPRACYWSYWPAPQCWKDKTRHPFDMYLGRAGRDFRFVFPVEQDRLLLGSAPLKESAKAWKQDLKAAYRADLSCDPIIRPLIEDNEPAEEIRGTLSERYFFREAAGPGWVLIGDAGHHKDFIIGDGMTEALLQAQSLAAAILDGGLDGGGLPDWWRRRDVEALAMFRFAQDQGMPAPAPSLVKRLYRRLARTAGGGTRLLDILERHVTPYEAIPIPMALRTVLDGMLAGDFAVLPDFLAQAKRASSVGKEVAARRAGGLAH